MKQAVVVLSLIFTLARSEPVPASDEAVLFGRFGTVTIYRTTEQPTALVIFVSGDGGWNKGVVDMARELAGPDAVVAGVDINSYRRNIGSSTGPCLYVAADFEGLSKFVQKKLGFPRYAQPVLAGYSSGATLVYAALAQAPPNTFRGAISMGFCPDLAISKPLCRGQGLNSKKGPRSGDYSLRPAASLPSPWIVLQGAIDQVCRAPMVEEYARQVPGSEIMLLPGVGHGFAVQRNWLPQFKQAFGRLAMGEERTAGEGSPVSDLPLVEVPSQESPGGLFAVILTGDGGWAGLDREVGTVLASQGMPVVGFNSLQYFWTKRTPDGASRDLERVLRHYLALWKKDRAVLIGYSLGADVLPFMANRLPRDLREKVRLVALLGPGRTAEFEFHLGEWLGHFERRSAKTVLPEVEKLQGIPVLCVYGDKERESLCPMLGHGLAETMVVKGGHHFGGAYKRIAVLILQRTRQRSF